MKPRRNLRNALKLLSGIGILGMLLVGCQGQVVDRPGSGAHKEHQMPQIKPSAEFEPLRALVGKWKGVGQMPEGEQDVEVEYSLTAAGTVLTETLAPGQPHEMLSVYHGDGPQVIMTHYCAFGNQPRMRLEKGDDPKVLRFVYMDGTSIQSEDDPHMHQLTLTLVDADHLIHEWVFFDKGKSSHVTRFDLQRQK